MDCSKEFTVPKFGLQSYEIRCNPCIVAKAAKDAIKESEAHSAEWSRRCPAQFRDTDASKLPSPESVSRALEWQYGSIGLLLHGPTGTGKSRTAWLVLKKVYDQRKTFKVLNSLAGLEYASLYSQGAEKVEKWVGELVSVDVLFMDDIFKNKLTDSFEGIIFSILDRRIESGKPVILSANDTGTTLAGRMTEDRGEPLVRRLREFCLALRFSKAS